MTGDELRWDHVPQLRSPILLAAFEGWNDAGDGASMALGHIGSMWDAQKFAVIEAEEFFDFSSTRPTVRLSDGERVIEWPENSFSALSVPDHSHDFVLLKGNEPQLRWKTFCAHVLEVAKRLDVKMVVTLGALLADVPHTRAVRITATGISPEMIDRYDLQRSRYEGPTGIVGVLHDAFAKAGIASCSLWAAVPHYLPGTPSPKAALALIERASDLLNLRIPTLALEIAAAQYERQVNEVIEADDDMIAYVQRLEEGHDSGDDLDDDDEDDLDPIGAEPSLKDADGRLPSGEELAAELEEFLRDNGSK
jgi:proteasome assembly chaperone (PAC2) family protein